MRRRQSSRPSRLRFTFHVNDLSERLVDVVGHDLMAVDVDLVENRLVELAPSRVLDHGLLDDADL